MTPLRYYLISQFHGPRGRRTGRSRKREQTSSQRELFTYYEPEVIPRRPTPQRAEVVQRQEIKPRREIRPRRELRVSPEVRRLYDIWAQKYQSDKLQGIKRKQLPIGALEKWYETRKAAFSMETGADPVLFDDQLDNLDVAIASDSWHDLDSELERHNLLYDAPSMAELRREARMHEREEKEVAEQYEEYVASQASAG